MKLTIDGVEIEADEGQTIIEAAAAAGIEIPTLCHTPGLDPVGVCRMCVAGREIDLEPGDTVVVEPGEVHSMQNTGTVEVNYLVVCRKWLR